MKKFNKHLLAIIMALICALSLLACTAEDQDSDSGTATTTASADQGQTTGEVEAKYSITFIVVHADGTSRSFDIKTDREILSDALLDEGLIEGENDVYGLYVKVVDGERADYNTDQAYWSLYIGDELAMTGVSGTQITDGATYKFVYTK